MLRLPQLRVIIETEPYSGEWNMAVDEALLETAISTGQATLRWYRWDEPTVSLGYFQKFDELAADAVLSQLPMVRRLTGGGAILHDDEWTYSVALPAAQRLFEQPQQLYDIIHGNVSAGLNDLGVPVAFRGTTLKRPDEPLLCFQRQDSHDVTLHGRKVLGSAQRRRRGAILQHGSLLIRASRLANDVPGITDLCRVSLPENLAEQLAIRIATTIALSWQFGQLSAAEISLTTRLSQEQAANVRLR